MTLDQLSGDPHPVLARLREREPVSWLPAIGGWLITGRDEAIAAMRDDAAFTVDDPRFSTAKVIGPSMLSTDGAEHMRHRGPFAGPFQGGDVRRRFGAWIEARARELVAALAPDGAAELRTAVAAPLAIEAVAEILGMDDGGPLLDWYEAIVASVEAVTVGGEVQPEGRAAFAALSGVVNEAIATPGTLLSEVAAGGGLGLGEITSNAAVLLFGGIVTSESTNAQALADLLGHPEQLERVRADGSLVANAVEETMRLEPAAAVVDRYATRDVDLGGAPIAAGDLVRISLAGANRDPATFADPDRYDVTRANARQHLAFARGPHVCLGIHLARLEARALVAAFLETLPDARLDPARTTPPAGLVFRRPEQVWATWPSGQRT